MYKYVKVIMGNEKSDLLIKNIKIINSLFINPEVNTIIKTPYVSADKKIEFLLSFCDESFEELRNLLKLLALNNKLSLIPLLCETLEKQVLLSKGIVKGFIYTEQQLNDDDLKNFELHLSNYFEKQIYLENKISSTNEIKVCLDDLGYEIVFSIDTLRQQLKKYIIQAI